jgi:ribosomal-protein-serine acetyltransferase
MRIPESVDAGLIRLQRWTLERAEDLDQAIEVSLSELMPFMPWATQGHDLEATTSYLVASQREWDNGENFNYAMLTASHEVVGGCGLMVRQGPDVFEIGYWVHSAHAGRGYATLAAMVLAEVGLAQAGIDRVEIRHDVANPASGRVAAKAGFRQVGRVEAVWRAPSDSGMHLVWVRRRP